MESAPADTLNHIGRVICGAVIDTDDFGMLKVLFQHGEDGPQKPLYPFSRVVNIHHSGNKIFLFIHDRSAPRPNRKLCLSFQKAHPHKWGGWNIFESPWAWNCRFELIGMGFMENKDECIGKTVVVFEIFPRQAGHIGKGCGRLRGADVAVAQVFRRAGPTASFLTRECGKSGA